MSNRRILLLGGAGLLGSALKDELSAGGHLLLAPAHSELEIADYDKILLCAREFSPDTIVNCAGFNQVDECERRKELAFQANAFGAGNLARIAAEIGAAIFQVSSDYIFKGDKKGEYREEDLPDPLNLYGKSKLLGESAVRENAREFCVIRASWLFGPGGPNFISKILTKWKAGAQELKVVSDEKGKPTYSLDLANAIRLSVERNLRGIYHFCNQGTVSWMELAQEVFEIIGKGPKLIPVSAEAYRLPAQRPKNSALSSKKIEAALGLTIRPHLEALKDYLEKMEI